MRVVEIDNTGICYHVANIDDELESEIKETSTKFILRDDKLNGLSDGETPIDYTWTGTTWINPMNTEEAIATLGDTSTNNTSTEDKLLSFMENMDQRMTNIENKLNS